MLSENQNTCSFSKVTFFNGGFKTHRILLVDDDPSALSFLRTIFSSFANFKIFTAGDPYEVIDILNHQVIDTIILDWSLPLMTGPQTLLRSEEILSSDPDVPLEWDQKKVNVIFFSIKDSWECKSINTQHFKYRGYISKNKTNLIRFSETFFKLYHRMNHK
jgi:CheY-like chemotaxis protein